MQVLSLAQPIENVENSEEARVLAIIDHLAPMLDDWREGQDLQREAGRIASDLASQREQFAKTRSKIDALARHAEAAAGSVKMLGIAAIALCVIGAAVTVLMHAGLIGMLFFAGAIAMGGLWLNKRKKSDASRVERTRLEAEAAQLDTAISALTARLSTINDERERRSGGFPPLKLADIRFGLKIMELAGHNVIIDESGSFPETALRTIGVSTLQSGVREISAKVDALLNVPPMLSPDNASDEAEPIDRLFGEENDLSNLVTDFTHSLGLLSNVELFLPLVPGESAVAQRLAAGVLPHAGSGAALAAGGVGSASAEVRSFADQVDRTKRDGQHLFADLQDVFQRLNMACQLYSDARSQSVNTLHSSLLEILQRATWCSRRFYCARTIMSPQYLEDLIGAPLDQAYRLDLDDLVDGLRSDEAISLRLDIKPELEGQLREAHLSVQEFMGGFEENSAAAASRPRHIEEQFRECIHGFRRILQKVMTGSSFPVLNFSAEALLYYDPDTEEWSSGLTPYVYRSHEVMRYGGVVKAYSDLMIPLWEHLWTEKADFRKSETFRTNAQMIHMSEKEAEKLIDIANQYRNDLRSVRENMNILGSDLKSKAAEIVNFRDGMDSLGLLSARAKATIDRNEAQLGDGDDDMVARAERFETILAAQPQAQMESRGTVQDPIDLVRGVDALLRVTTGSGQRLLSA